MPGLLYRVLSTVRIFSGHRNACGQCHQRCVSSMYEKMTHWQLFSAVCLERLPVINKEMNKLEKDVLSLMQQLEIDRSLKSDHELRYLKDINIAEQKKSSIFDEEEGETARQTTAEIEDAWDVELSQFTPAPRITEADKNNDRHSVRRKLDAKLVLIIKQKLGAETHWILPQGAWQQGESMRQTAERVLRTRCGDDLNSFFLGNAPCGFYKYKFHSDTENCNGVKIFFFRAFYQGGNVTKLDHDEVSDFLWVTKAELSDYFIPGYLKCVCKFILDL